MRPSSSKIRSLKGKKVLSKLHTFEMQTRVALGCSGALGTPRHHSTLSTLRLRRQAFQGQQLRQELDRTRDPLRIHPTFKSQNGAVNAQCDGILSFFVFRLGCTAHSITNCNAMPHPSMRFAISSTNLICMVYNN